MAEQQNKPISALVELDSFSGNEKLPLAIGMASNRSARLGVLKEYFKDSTVVMFNTISDANPQQVSDLPFAREDGALYFIAYLTSRKLFVEVMYFNSQYAFTTNFNRWEDYMTATTTEGVTVKTVRGDKVFLNLNNKELYMYNVELRNIFDSIRINVMTEEELENLENPIEGAIYATLE